MGVLQADSKNEVAKRSNTFSLQLAGEFFFFFLIFDLNFLKPVYGQGLTGSRFKVQFFTNTSTQKSIISKIYPKIPDNCRALLIFLKKKKQIRSIDKLWAGTNYSGVSFEKVL